MEAYNAVIVMLLLYANTSLLLLNIFVVSSSNSSIHILTTDPLFKVYQYSHLATTNVSAFCNVSPLTCFTTDVYEWVQQLGKPVDLSHQADTALCGTTDDDV